MKVLRAVLPGVVALLMATTAAAQNTSLIIDGVTAGDNSATVNVAAGATITIVIANASTPNRPYGLFGALNNNGNAVGWYLAPTMTKKPFPVVTGVATSLVENDYGVDIFPDRSSNPNVRLGPSGSVTLTLRVPNSASGTMYFQAVTLPQGSSTTNFSNAIRVNYVAAANAARLLVSQSATSVDAVQFGVLQWNNGDPRTATFAPTAGLTNIRPDAIVTGDVSEWISHFTSAGADKPRDVDWRSATFGPALNNDNHEYHRVSLPRLPGVDGQFGTNDDIPARDLMRCYDNVTLEGFYLVVNKGPNPNTPGIDFFAIPGTRFRDTVNNALNSWKVALQVSPDGSRAASIYDDSSTAAGFEPQMFLFATDGSLAYRDAGNNPVATVNVTPSGTKNFNSSNNIRTTIFTNNRLWLTRDIGTSADADGRNDMTLWTVDIRVLRPSPVQVTIPINTNYSPTALDSIPEKCMLVPSRGGTTMCFLAGDTITTTPAPAPDFVQKGDWYAVNESNPTAAVNLTKFRLYGATNAIPKLLVPGDTYNGTQGWGAISPDATRLAFVSQHSNENGTSFGEDDEVYFCTTRDSDGNGEGDDANTLFDAPITTNARIDSRNGSPDSVRLDNAQDFFLSDANTLFFFYGINNSTAATVDRQMDLFAWNALTGTLSDVTTPSKVPPITGAGTIAPEGYFYSPGGRFFYFSRGVNGAGITKTNLVGVDAQQRKAFNVTGNEYSGSTTSDTTNTAAAGENFPWHLSYAGGSYPSLCFFSAPLLNVTTATQEWNQIWVFDANFPTAAIQLTNDQSAGNAKQNVDSLTANPHALGCVWAWERATSAAADIQYQDLLYFFRDVLSDTTTPFTSTCTLAAFDWVRAATSSDLSGAAPPGLICAIGDLGTDQASDAEFYYFSLNGTTNYDFDNTTGVDAPGHEVGTTALSGGRFTGFIQIYHADVQ